MIYKYYLDGDLIAEPTGWDKFTTDIRRDKQTNSLTISRDLQLIFGDRQYDYFTTKIDSIGYCGECEIIIYSSEDGGDNWNEFHRGVIYLSDIAFDEKRRECTAKIQDNSFYAYINNNFSIGAYIYADKTKNALPIIPPTPQQINFFECATGNQIPPNTAGYEYKCYFVFDIFKYLIEFISDGKVEFQSATFDIGGEFHDYVITTGYVLRYSIQNGYNGAVNPAGVNQTQFNSSFPQISLKDFYDEMQKRFNLVYWIDNSGTKPIFRIESESNSRINQITNLANVFIDELTHEVDNQFLYSNVTIGSGATEPQTPFTIFPQTLNLVGFKDEEFLVTGQCNLDNTLDLSTQYIQDTNVIQDCLEQGWATAFTNDYDNQLFIINVAYNSGISQYDAVISNWLSSSLVYYYNEQLNNYHILERFFNGIPTALAQYAGFGDNTFRAYQNPMGAYPQFITNEPIVFSDVTAPNGFDPSGNYDVVNNRYIAPLEGIYNFRLQVGTIYTAVPPQGAEWICKIYDSSNVLQGGSLKYDSLPYAGVFPDVSIEFDPVYMGVGWYAQIAYRFSGSTNSADSQTYIYFECTSATNSGNINFSDASKTPLVKYTFKIPMDYQELKLVENNLIGMIPFRRYSDNGTRYGWIKSLRYNHKDCIADIVLIASKNDLFGGVIPPPPPPPFTFGYELREDGSYELREDSFKELREN